MRRIFGLRGEDICMFLCSLFFASSLAFHIPNALAANGQLVPPYDDYGKDTDGDSYYNFLVVNVSVNILQADNYIVDVDLYDSGGATLITTNYVPQYLGVGPHTIPLNLEGVDIYNSKIDGPYLARLYLYDQIWTQLDNDTYNTNSYLYTAFQRPPAEFKPPHYDYGLDLNSNSLYDFLVANVNITVHTADTYDIIGKLYDNSGTTLIAIESNSSSFGKGDYTVQLLFMGFSIRKSQKNGPYDLELSLKRGGTDLVAQDTYMTNAYTWNQFDGRPAYFNPPHSDAGLDLDADGLFDYLVINVSIQVNISGVYQVLSDLWDKIGGINYITSASNSSYFDAGPQHMDLHFAGFEIYAAGYSAQYGADLELKDEKGRTIQLGEYQTSKYFYDDFDSTPPVTFNRDHQDYGLDTDSDSFYNYLVVNASVNASAGGKYEIRGRLYDYTHSTFITQTENLTNLAKGMNKVPLWLNGGDIYNSSIDGPYNVTLYLYDLYTIQLEKAYYNSSSYLYVQFEHEIPDQTPPEIMDVVCNPDPQEVFNSVNVSANVTDLSGISQVLLNVTDPDFQPLGSFSMNYDAGAARYYYEQAYDKVGIFTFEIAAQDSYGNWNSTTNQFTMKDGTPPSVGGIQTSPSPQEVFGNVNISALITDNYQLSGCWIEVADPAGTPVGNFTMLYDSASGRYYKERSYSKVGTYHFVISAKDTSNNWASSSGSFIMQDNTKPTISSVSAIPDPQEVFGNVNISASINDNYGLAGAWVEIFDPDNLLIGNYSMSYDGGSGRYYCDRPYLKTGDHSFIIWAKDVSNNWASASGFFHVRDTTSPTIRNVVASPNPQLQNEYVNITADVSDNYALYGVWIEVKNPYGTVVYNGSMSYYGGLYYCNNSYQDVGFYTFNISSNDTSDNWEYFEGQFQILEVIIDRLPPELSDVRASPDPQEVFGCVNLSAIITDDVQVYGAWVEVYDPSSSLMGNFSMKYDSGRYYHNLSYHELGTYSFIIYANDTSDKWNSSAGFFHIQDSTPPSIRNVTVIPDPQDVFGSVNVSASVDDNYLLVDVKIEIIDPDGLKLGNFTMAYDSIGQRYYHNRSYDRIGLFSYCMWASDSSGNLASWRGSFTVRDTESPSVTSVSAVPSPQEVYGVVNVSAVLSDNYKLAGGWVEVYDPSNSLVGNFTMKYDAVSGRYYHEAAYSLMGFYSFTIWTNDTSNNWNGTSGKFEIRDTTMPEIRSVAAVPDPQIVGGYVNITAVVTDNYALYAVRINITDPDGLVVYDGPMSYDQASSKYYSYRNYSKLGVFNFTISANDTSGNWAYYAGQFSIESSPQDLVPPQIWEVSSVPLPQELGGFVNISARVTDNWGVYGVWVAVYDPSDFFLGNYSMPYDLPNDRYYYNSSYFQLGTYSFLISANDSSDNWNSSAGNFSVVDTTPPDISDLKAEPSPQEVFGLVNISSVVADNSDILEVRVNITNPSGSLLGNFTMSLDASSGRYYLNRSYSSIGFFNYTIFATDSSGNSKRASGSFEVVDSTLPFLGDARAFPDPQFLDSFVNISVLASDNYELVEVILNVTDPYGMTAHYGPMAFDEGTGRYYYGSAYHKIGVFDYLITARDSSGNLASLGGNFTIQTLPGDDEPPRIEDVQPTPSHQETGMVVNISALIYDNWSVHSAWIEVYDPVGSLLGNFTMRYDSSSGRYYHSSAFHDLGQYSFIIFANDSSGNANSTSGFFWIEDWTEPSITDVRVDPDPQEVHNVVRISAVVEDNYGVLEVTITLTDPEGTMVGNFSMNYDSGRYYYDYRCSIVGTYEFSIAASDSSGNWGSFPGSYRIRDTTSPQISSLLVQPEIQQVFGTVNISAAVGDNYQLDGVWIEIRGPQGSLIGNFSMLYDLPSAMWFYESSYSDLGTFSFLISCRDSSGNWASEAGEFEIRDDTPPTARAGSDVQIQEGESATLDGSLSEDNFSITNLSWTFNDGTHDVVLYGAIVRHAFHTPGHYLVTLLVRDSSGNIDSDTIWVNVSAKPSPKPPSDLAISHIGEGYLMLRWVAPMENEDGSPLTDLAGYNIYRSSAPGGPYTKLNSQILAGATFNDTGHSAGFIAYYVVTAVNSKGYESAHSNEVQGEIPSKGSIEGKVVDERGSPEGGARIELKKDGLPIRSTYSSEDGNFTFSGVESGTYTLFAYKSGEGSCSRTVTVLAGETTAVTMELHPAQESVFPFFLLIIPCVIALVVVVFFILWKRQRGRERARKGKR